MDEKTRLTHEKNEDDGGDRIGLGKSAMVCKIMGRVICFYYDKCSCSTMMSEAVSGVRRRLAAIQKHVKKKRNRPTCA